MIWRASLWTFKIIYIYIYIWWHMCVSTVVAFDDKCREHFEFYLIVGFICALWTNVYCLNIGIPKFILSLIQLTNNHSLRTCILWSMLSGCWTWCSMPVGINGFFYFCSILGMQKLFKKRLQRKQDKLQGVAALGIKTRRSKTSSVLEGLLSR